MKKGCLRILVCVCCGAIGLGLFLYLGATQGPAWEKLPSPTEKIAEISKIHVTSDDRIRSEALVRTEAGELYMCRSGHPSCLLSEVSEKQALGMECYSRPTQQDLGLNFPSGKMINSCRIIDVDGTITVTLLEDNSLWLKENWWGAFGYEATFLFGGILGGIIGLVVGLLWVFVAWVIRKIGKARQAAP